MCICREFAELEGEGTDKKYLLCFCLLHLDNNMEKQSFGINKRKRYQRNFREKEAVNLTKNSPKTGTSGRTILESIPMTESSSLINVSATKDVSRVAGEHVIGRDLKLEPESSGDSSSQAQHYVEDLSEPTTSAIAITTDTILEGMSPRQWKVALRRQRKALRREEAL